MEKKDKFPLKTADGSNVRTLPVEMLRKAAEQGHAGAQCNLGRRYYDGEGVEQNEKEAVKWLNKAAVQNNYFAQEILKQIRKRSCK